MNEVDKSEIKKIMMNRKEENPKEDLETTQKRIEETAKKVAHTTKFKRDKEVKQTPKKVRIREVAAARSTKVIKGMLLKKQARKVWAGHL